MYDNTCRFLAENFSADFASWLLGEPLPLTELKPSELSLEPIRADALILLQSAFLPRPDENGKENKKPRVLLIDEIDKSDIDLPNNLLHIFEEGEVSNSRVRADCRSRGKEDSDSIGNRFVYTYAEILYLVQHHIQLTMPQAPDRSR